MKQLIIKIVNFVNHNNDDVNVVPPISFEEEMFLKHVIELNKIEIRKEMSLIDLLVDNLFEQDTI